MSLDHAKPRAYLGQIWRDKQDGSHARVVEVTRHSIRYTPTDLPDLILARRKRGFFEDFTLVAMQPNTTDDLDE